MASTLRVLYFDHDVRIALGRVDSREEAGLSPFSSALFPLAFSEAFEVRFGRGVVDTDIGIVAILV